MGRLKDAFTYLQAGSKPKALEIAQSADLRQMNERGQSLMFAAAGRPLNKGSAELLCQILQKRGLAVDALDGHHQTPLFASAREGNEICADWLIAQGCAVDHADFRGETPLCIAFRNSQMEMVMKLLKHGASLGVKDMYGGRQPPFFANPIFRRAFVEKQAEQRGIFFVFCFCAWLLGFWLLRLLAPMAPIVPMTAMAPIAPMTPMASM